MKILKIFVFLWKTTTCAYLFRVSTDKSLIYILSERFLEQKRNACISCLIEASYVISILKSFKYF